MKNLFVKFVIYLAPILIASAILFSVAKKNTLRFEGTITEQITTVGEQVYFLPSIKADRFEK